MSGAGLIMQPVNEFNFPVLNQPAEAGALSMLYHDYEEIDETVLNDIPEFRTIQLEESDSDSKEGSHSKPTEDDEGYLHPYHSLIHPERKIQIRNINLPIKDGAINWNHSQYDCLILSKPTDNQLKKTISMDTYLRTTGNRSECTNVNRKTI